MEPRRGSSSSLTSTLLCHADSGTVVRLSDGRQAVWRSAARWKVAGWDWHLLRWTRGLNSGGRGRGGGGPSRGGDPVNVLDPIQIGSEALARSGLDDSCTPACFQTGSIWLKPDPVTQNQTRSGPILHNMIRAACEGTQLSVKVGGMMILSCRLTSGPDAVGQNLTEPCRLDPSLLCTIWARPSLEKQSRIMREVGSGIYIQSGTIVVACWPSWL